MRYKCPRQNHSSLGHKYWRPLPCTHPELIPQGHGRCVWLDHKTRNHSFVGGYDDDWHEHEYELDRVRQNLLVHSVQNWLKQWHTGPPSARYMANTLTADILNNGFIPPKFIWLVLKLHWAMVRCTVHGPPRRWTSLLSGLMTLRNLSRGFNSWENGFVLYHDCFFKCLGCVLVCRRFLQKVITFYLYNLPYLI